MAKIKGINTDSRTVNSLKNISSGVVSQIIFTILGFVSRTLFIKYLAIEYLGVNGLFSSILSVLSFAELGMGSAFVYSLYKPLAEKDEAGVASVLNLYRKAYTIIGVTVLLLGLAILPFLNQIIPVIPTVITESIYVIYSIFLFNAASSYFFSYKVSLLNADQRNYITTINYLVFYILQNVTQIVVLIVYKNFLYYLLVQLLCQFLSNLSISILVNKKYPFLAKYDKNTINQEVKKEVFSNAKATFVIKVGGILVNSTDNLIINYFSGLASIGLLSNYYLLMGIPGALISQIFTSVSASVANVNAIESKEKQYETFSMLNLANFWIYGFSAITFVILSKDFIVLWIGTDYTLSLPIAIMIAINFFMVGLQSTIWTFKSTYGFFHEGKYFVIGTAILNIAFSFLLGHYWGLFGILLATALARLLTNFWYDPYIVFKLGLKINPLVYLKKLAVYTLIISLAGSATYYVASFCLFSNLVNLIIKLIICLVIPNAIIILFYKNTDEFKKVKQLFLESFGTISKKITR